MLTTPRMYIGQILNLSGLFGHFLIFIISFLLPIQSVLLATGVLILFDLITGLWASHKNKIPITSIKLSNTISKSLLYMIAILAFRCAEIFLVPEIPFTRIIAGFIAITEIKSISENASKILGTDLWKYVKDLIDRNKKDV